jgi:hypothetical protein
LSENKLFIENAGVGGRVREKEKGIGLEYSIYGI